MLQSSAGPLREASNAIFAGNSFLILLAAIIISLVLGKLVAVVLRRASRSVGRRADASSDLGTVNRMRRIETWLILSIAIARVVFVIIGLYVWWIVTHPNQQPTALVGASALLIVVIGGARGYGIDEETRKVVLEDAGEFIDIPIAPEGVRSVLAFARDDIGISRSFLNAILIEKGIVPTKYRFAGNVALGIKPDDQAIVLADPAIIRRPPDDVKSVNVFAKELGIAFTTLKDSLEEAGIMLPDYKFGPKVSGGLDEATKAQVRELPRIKDLTLPEAPSGVKSIKTMATETGMSKSRINQIISEEGLALPRYRFGSVVTIGIDEKTQKFIESKRGPRKRRVDSDGKVTKEPNA